MECFFALTKAGMVLVPLNNRLSRSEFAFILNDSEAATLIFGPEYASVVDGIRPEIPDVKNFICAGKELERSYSYEALLESQSSKDPMIEVNEDDLYSLRYTSSTTGTPKGVMAQQKAEVASAINQVLDRKPC
jgi:acyl-CoA synthetase (AMP-forming)/AMP-acid ligase II